MKSFTDENGQRWVATALEEETPRHHGRWYLVLHPENDTRNVLPIPEVRWQTAATAARTLRTMSDFELRRRLNSVQQRTAAEPVSLAEAEGKAPRVQTSANAG